MVGYNIIQGSAFTDIASMKNAGIGIDTAFTLDQELKCNGNNSLHVKVEGSTKTTYNGFYINKIGQKNAFLEYLIPGQTYTISLYVYTKDVSSLTNSINWRITKRRSDGTYDYGKTFDKNNLKNNEWVRLTRQVYIDEDLQSANLTFQMVNDGELWISSPKVEIGTEATDWRPNPADILDTTKYKFYALASDRLTLARVDDGTSISKIEYVQTTSATIPTTGWATGYPTLKKGSYIWTRITFSDGKVTTTSSYLGTDGDIQEAIKQAKDTAQKAIDNLTIGGRNIFEQTNQGKKNWDWRLGVGDVTIEDYLENGIKGVRLTRGTVEMQKWSYISYSNIGRAKFKPSTTYTITLDVKGSVDSPFYLSLMNQAGGNRLNKQNIKIGTCGKDTWTTLSTQLTTLDTLPEGTDQILYISGMNSSTGVSYCFRNLKCEIGTKATDWTPAPEDLQADIDKAQSSADKAQQDANNASNKADNANSKADGAQHTANGAQQSADTALKQAQEAQAKAKTAQETSDQANETAHNVKTDFDRLNQVFVADSSGAKVYEKANANNYAQIRSDGMYVVAQGSNGQQDVAKFGLQSNIKNLTVEQYLYVGHHRVETFSAVPPNSKDAESVTGFFFDDTKKGA